MQKPWSGGSFIRMLHERLHRVCVCSLSFSFHVSFCIHQRRSCVCEGARVGGSKVSCCKLRNQAFRLKEERWRGPIQRVHDRVTWHHLKRIPMKCEWTLPESTRSIQLTSFGQDSQEIKVLHLLVYYRRSSSQPHTFSCAPWQLSFFDMCVQFFAGKARWKMIGWFSRRSRAEWTSRCSTFERQVVELW